jgi:hypothetical protein
MLVLTEILDNVFCGCLFEDAGKLSCNLKTIFISYKYCSVGGKCMGNWRFYNKDALNIKKVIVLFLRQTGLLILGKDIGNRTEKTSSIWKGYWFIKIVIYT